jgi:hypothetical protein
MYSDMEESRRNIEDMESQIAFLISNAEMEKRAQELGFERVSGEDIFYILVPGYFKSDQIELAGSPVSSLPTIPTVAPEYTQSLMDWLRDRVFDPASPLVQKVKP